MPDYEEALSHSTVVIFEIYIKAFKIICSFDMILFTMLHIPTLYTAVMTAIQEASISEIIIIY